jgi:hypothetical protein
MKKKNPGVKPLGNASENSDSTDGKGDEPEKAKV